MDLNLKKGDKLTMIGVSSALAMTFKNEIKIVDTAFQHMGRPVVVFSDKGKRKKFVFKADKNLIFYGWDVSLKRDGDVSSGGIQIMRGNALINLVGNPQEIREYIEKYNINPDADKSRVLAIGPNGEDDEAPVYPELAEKAGHAVMDRILSKASVA